MFDRDPLRTCPGHGAGGDFDRLVVGVIQQLNLQTVVGVIDFRNRFDEAFDDVQLVVDRQLYRDTRPDFWNTQRGAPVTMFQINKDQCPAVQTVDREKPEEREISDQYQVRHRCFRPPRGQKNSLAEISYQGTGCPGLGAR